jgi:hypothetical protein
MEMFLTGLLLGIALGFVWGVWRATQSFIQRIVEQPEEIRELMNRVDLAVKKETDTQEPKSEEYRTEWHQGVCYLYDSKDRFMAQGADVLEAMSNAEKRFPGIKLNFRVNEPNKSNQ